MTLQTRFPHAAPWIILMAALWAQVFYASSYGWRYGEYYDYGWYVPPLAIWFFYRRWRDWPVVTRKPLSLGLVVSGAIILTAALTGLRTLGLTDPAWTLPLWWLAAIATGMSLLACWWLAGKSGLRGIVPVLLFALTAVRLPAQLEHGLVDSLTHGVLDSSSGLFRVLGREVLVVGNQLELMGQVVEVTEGCSGIRSAQSFLMATLCLGEWLRLSWKSRVLMVGLGFVSAWVMNVARACLLASVRFDHGDAAFDKAHDLVGLATFVIGTAILLSVAMALDRKRKNSRVVRKLVEGGRA